MNAKHISAIIIFVVGASLAAIRRWKNEKEPEAGMYLAGWTLFAVIFTLSD